MSGVQTFTDLLFWQRAREWAKRIFPLTQSAPFSSDRRLVEQLNDSADSVMANIAEGFGRGTQNEFVQFLGYSLGSLNETQSHLCVAYDRGYISRETFADLFSHGTEVRKLTVKFLRSMKLAGSGVKHLGTQVRKDWMDESWERYERLTGQQRPEIFRKKPPDDDEKPIRPSRNDNPPM